MGTGLNPENRSIFVASNLTRDDPHIVVFGGTNFRAFASLYDAHLFYEQLSKVWSEVALYRLVKRTSREENLCRMDPQMDRMDRIFDP